MNINERINLIKNDANINNVPIMQDEGIEFLINYIEKNNILNILEIGSAIGYSAIRMALVNPNIKITTIERDEVRYLEAVKNIKEVDLENQITVIFGDALDIDIKDRFDLVFIDAAKGQNIKFFEKFGNNIRSGGTIITDNIYFHGLVDMELVEIASRNLRQLVKKIKNYIKYLENNNDYVTKILRLGDGISISIKK